MSIKKINESTYSIDVRLWFKSKEYRKRETFTGGIKAAKSREYEIKEELRTKVEKLNGSFKYRTFGEVLNFYKERKELGRSKCLFDRLEADLGEIEICDLKSHFDLWFEEIKKQYSIATANRYLSFSKAAINLSIRFENLKDNPLKVFKKEKEVPRDRLLSFEEKNRLLTVIYDKAPELYPIVKYSLLVPCRKGELIAMKKEWYDMVNNCIHIPAEFTKTEQACSKPIPEELTDYMRNIPKASEWIFYRKVKGEYRPLGNFSKKWRSCLKLAEIQNYRFHDGRRGSYTDLILAGNLPHVVQKISGHATDMSKVYLNISNMQAIKSVKFPINPDKNGQSTGQQSQGNE